MTDAQRSSLPSPLTAALSDEVLKEAVKAFQSARADAYLGWPEPMTKAESEEGIDNGCKAMRAVLLAALEAREREREEWMPMKLFPGHRRVLVQFKDGTVSLGRWSAVHERVWIQGVGYPEGGEMVAWRDEPAPSSSPAGGRE